MIQKHHVKLIFALLVISLFAAGNAFATNYAYLSVPGTDVIKIYNYEGNSLYAIIDLDQASDYDFTDTADYEDRLEGTVGQAYGSIAAMAVGPQERYLYIATDRGANTAGRLYQLDITGDPSENEESLVLTFLSDVGVQPKDIVADLAANYVFIANYGSNTVTKYVKGTATVYTISGFYSPVALTVTAGNATRGSDLYVANYAANGDGKYVVTMYNPTKMIEVPVTNQPTDLVATLDNEYVYVANSSDTAGLISVIRPVDYYDYDDDDDEIVDEGENTVVDTITIEGAKPTRMAIADIENYIYAIDPVFTEAAGDVTVASGDGIMTVIDISGREELENDYSNKITTAAAAESTVEASYSGGYSGGISIAATRNGTSVFTLTGAENSFFLTDTDDTDLPAVFFDTTDGVTEVYSQIVLSGVLPTAISSLDPDTEGKTIVLEWEDNADDEIGYFIYRLDNDVEEKEYKYHLIDVVASDTLSLTEYDLVTYTDDTVHKGDSYSYLVVPFNEITRASTGSSVSINAKDDDSSEICFIGSACQSGLNIMALVLLAGIFPAFFLLGRKD